MPERVNTERFFVDKYPVRIDPQTGKIAFCFIDDGAFAGPGFDTWLGQYDALIREMSGIEIVYLSASPTTFGAARKQFDRQFSTAAAGTNPADLLV